MQELLEPVPNSSRFSRYVIAIACAVLSVLLRWLLDPVLGHVAFYVTVYVAVVYCALLCGYAPATVTAVMGFFGIYYWFVDPRHSIIPVPSEVHGVVGFFLVSAVLIYLGEANRSKQLRLNETVAALVAEARERQRAQDELRAAHATLEQRVEERTCELSAALARVESEIAVRERAEEQLRHLSLRVMNLQDEERRHIARELHDTAGQTLAAIKMSVALIAQSIKNRPELQLLIDDLNALTDGALQEVRTTSYLLHPPLLDEAGIASATRWFVEGFARRSGIEVQCNIPEKMDRPPRECELVLFRVLQESLTNVHRHSGASSAKITLQRTNGQLQLEIEDNGKGISEERLRRLDTSAAHTGVGIAGMRERVRELGGLMEVQSAGQGTTVRVVLPITHRIDSEDPQLSAEPQSA
ncbi:MAG TPA: sensor histidine kinase [Candidatus Sulfotelmatobacter sp.]|nr:sensor histidine kinase [Candidatus Sulfotelmatobacter sp.]